MVTFRDESLDSVRSHENRLDVELRSPTAPGIVDAVMFAPQFALVREVD